MAWSELLDHLARDPNRIVLPAGEQPNVGPAHVVPEDVRAFYDSCGGLVIARGSPYEARIVGPDECVLANDVILGDNILGDLATVVREQLSGNASWDWYIIAEVENGNYLAIDFGRTHNGRCYDAFWETYASPGQMPAVAPSFTSLIEHLYENKGQHWYWLQPGFQLVGDAYDAT
jgi:antitoxin YokJ